MPGVAAFGQCLPDCALVRCTIKTRVRVKLGLGVGSPGLVGPRVELAVYKYYSTRTWAYGNATTDYLEPFIVRFLTFVAEGSDSVLKAGMTISSVSALLCCALQEKES